MTRRRRIAIGAATAAGLLLLAGPAAGAVDVWGNIGPASQLPSGALTDAYPLGNYALDHHFSAVDAGVFSGVDVSGLAPTIAWLLANLLWQLTVLLANAVITLFTFAFSLDLLNGSDATGGAGALAPVSDAVRSIYADVFGQAWLTVAVVLAGMWSMWNALVRRRYTETAGALSLSLLYIVIGLAFVTQPERTIGTASRWTNEIATAFLTLTSDGRVGGAEQSKQDASDHLFELLVYQPWVVLQFGGLEHCVRNPGADAPTDAPVRPLSTDPGRDVQLARQLARSPQIDADGKTCVNHRIKYAPRFLRFAPESDQRTAEYDALRDGDAGKLPDEDPAKDDGSYRLSAVDKPAAEAMGKSGQYQRLGLTVIVFFGELGAFLLLGALSVAVILAQVLVLLLLAFAPVALVIGTFPGRGHQFFLDWLTRLAAFLLRKAFYALVLAVVLAVSTALQDATASLGWFMAFGLQAVFFWAVFLSRKQLTGQLATATTGSTGQRDEARLLAGVGAAYAAGRLLRRSVGGIARAAGGNSSGRRGGGRSSTTSNPRPPEPPAVAPSRPTGPPPHDRHGPANDSASPSEDEPVLDGTDTPAFASPDEGGQPPRPRRNADPRPSRHDAVSEPDAAVTDSAVEQRPTDASPRHRVAGDDSRHGTEPERPELSRREPAASEPPPPPRQAPPTGPAPERPSVPDERPAHMADSPAESPLQVSLRDDASRLHGDAQRIHRDAQQLSDTPDRPDRSAPRPPTARPSRRGGGRP